MSFGSFHPLPPKPPKEKFLYGLSFTEAFIMIIGFIAAEKLMQVIPKLPIDDFILSRLHLGIPIVITAFFAFGRHPVTNLPIAQEILNWIEFRFFRKRVLEFKKERRVILG